jgi:hypothetical protein
LAEAHCSHVRTYCSTTEVSTAKEILRATSSCATQDCDAIEISIPPRIRYTLIRTCAFSLGTEQNGFRGVRKTRMMRFH